MKITNKPKEDETNYLVRDKTGFTRFVFNTYKNSNNKGSQEITKQFIIDTFGPKMINIINIFLKNKKNGDYLVRKFSPNAFTKYFARIAKNITQKKITVNMMRRIYLSNFLNTAPFMDKKQAVAEMMGNSVAIQQIYRKKD
jgi:hypothetical protein